MTQTDILELLEKNRLTSRAHPETSKESAALLNVDTLRTDLIALFYRSPQGLTCHDVAEKLNLQMNTATSQLSFMQQDGLIKAQGTCKSGKAQRQCSLFVLVPKEARAAAAAEYKRNKLVSRAVGNPELWGAMMQSIYVYSALNTQENGGKMANAANRWAISVAAELNDLEYQV